MNRVQDKVSEVEQQFRRGFITEDEQYVKTVELWTEATEEITEAVSKAFPEDSPVRVMANSGATKGGFTPLRQLAGMRGLMADPAGRIIPLPITSNFREGLTALESFLSTHRARKGLADTALRTADAGYLTAAVSSMWRRTSLSMRMIAGRMRVFGSLRIPRIAPASRSRSACSVGLRRAHSRRQDGRNPRPGGRGDRREAWALMKEARGVDCFVRSPLTCAARHGLCAKCYGRDLATRRTGRGRRGGRQ